MEDDICPCVSSLRPVVPHQEKPVSNSEILPHTLAQPYMLPVSTPSQYAHKLQNQTKLPHCIPYPSVVL